MATKISHDDLRALLLAALEAELESSDMCYMYCFIEDVFDDSVVYWLGQERLQRPFTVDEKTLAVTLGKGKEVIKVTTYKPVPFAIEAAFSDNEWVTLRGKVFQIGTFPDKAFSITEAEMDAAIASFSPVDNDLEHSPITNVLGKSLGGLQKLWRKGLDVFGEVTVPKWLSDLTDGKVKVSLAFDASRNIVGNALTLNPRITDAQVVAAFTDSPSASKVDQVTLRKLYDLAEKAADTTPAHAGPGGSMSEEKKTLKERVLAWFTNTKPDDIEQPELEAAFSETAAKVVEPAKVEKQELDPKIKAQMDELAESNAAYASQFANTAATAFADKAIADRKAFPVEKEKLVAAFSSALEADGGGKVTFSNGALTEGKHVKAVRDMIEARPAHNLSVETLSGLTGAVFSGTGTNPNGEKPDPARIKELKGMTDNGKAALAKENN